MILPFWPLIVALGALVAFVIVAAVRGNHIEILRNADKPPQPEPESDAEPEPAAPTDADAA